MKMYKMRSSVVAVKSFIVKTKRKKTLCCVNVFKRNRTFKKSERFRKIKREKKIKLFSTKNVFFLSRGFSFHCVKNREKME